MGIQFVSTIEGLDRIDQCRPKPAKFFIPKWFRDIPHADTNSGVATAKVCPSFPDYFSLGYVLPMWSDCRIKYDDSTKKWDWATPSNLFAWKTHYPEQFLNYVDASFSGVQGEFLFKAMCPWRIITPPGWSVLQLPLFYHFNREWSVLPGVIDTDIHNEINQQVLYHGSGRAITIKQGDPFVLYVPFQRSAKLEMEISYRTEEQKAMFAERDLHWDSNFSPNGIYRSWQRTRDRNEQDG